MLGNFRLAIAATAAILIGLWIVTGSQSFKSCIHDHKNDEAYYGLKDESVSNRFFARRHLQFDCAGEAIDKHNSVVTAIATVFIAFFTLTLWNATSEHSRITDRVLRLARDEFISTHRPRLRVRGILFEGFSNAEIGRAWIYVANVGVNDAFNIRFDAVFAQRDGNVRKPPWAENLSPDNRHGPQTLTGGKRDTYEPSIAADLMPFEAGEIRKETRTLLLIGRIHYSDAIGTERQAGFGWSYDPSTGEFRKPKGEDEYNYED